MTSGRVRLELGAEVALDGEIHRVDGFDGPAIRLRSRDGRVQVIATDTLFSDSGFRVTVANGSEAGEDRERVRDGFLELASPEDLAQAEALLAHLNEMVTGYRSGHAETALPSEPRPQYDPRVTLLLDRYAAKARELGKGQSTLRRLWQRYQEQGLIGLVDRRRVRVAPPLKNLDQRVRDAVLATLDDMTDTSNRSQAWIRRRVTARLDEAHGVGVVKCLPRSTFARILAELSRGRGTFGAAKQRRSIAHRPDTPYRRFKATRPGEFVLIDSTRLDVFAMNALTFEWQSLELTAAFDLFSRSMCAWRFTPVGAKAVDACLLLHDIVSTKAMRRGWPESARWRYHGVPENLVIDLSPPDGITEGPAGIPIIYPETVIVDHGKIFEARGFRDACAKLGINIQLARKGTPTDKPWIERMFATINRALLENLPGYKGPDLFSRGKDVESTAFYFVNEIEDFFAQWVATCWQPRAHDSLRLAAIPHRALSPNEMYDEGLARAGFLYLPRDPNLYRTLLPIEWRKIHHYGVDIGRLRYDDDGLNPYRNATSPYTGEHQGKWPIHYDPRDLSRVYFPDPYDGTWSTLFWTGADEPGRPFDDATLAYVKLRAAADAQNPPDHETIENAVNELIARIERDHLDRRDERRIAARYLVHTRQAALDRGETWNPPWSAGIGQRFSADTAPDLSDEDRRGFPIDDLEDWNVET